MAFRPRYVTFDCYGTLTRFRMGDMAREMFAGRIEPQQMDQFVADFAGTTERGAGHLEALRRRAEKRRAANVQEVGAALQRGRGRPTYDAVPTWGPHADVAAGLARIAPHIPLVILSNASNDQIQHNVAKLGAPFHAVFTAEQAQAYKPRMQAFEYMLDQLGCAPRDVLHVSSSLRYDLMTAHDLGGLENKVFVNRGHDPSVPYYGFTEIQDIGRLPAVVGL